MDAHLREYAILIPHTHNDGSPVTLAERAAIDAYALAHFGGYTTDGQCHGAWQDPTDRKIYHDVTTRYLLASRSYATVKAFAEMVAAMLGQLAMYVRLPSGTVNMLDTRPQSVAA